MNQDQAQNVALYITQVVYGGAIKLRTTDPLGIAIAIITMTASCFMHDPEFMYEVCSKMHGEVLNKPTALLKKLHEIAGDEGNCS